MDFEALKKINKSKNKKLAKKYYAFLASVAIIKQIPVSLDLVSTR
jgi:Holliday junction resolvase-like predicted endonuclease